MTTIGIDYTPAHEQGGGIGRYVRELVSALRKQDTDTHYRLLVAGAHISQLTPPLAPNFSWCPTHLNTKWLARIWHRARLPLPVEYITGQLDLFHATDFVLPPTCPSTRTLLTVHDLSFIRTPETASPRLRRYLSAVVPRSVAAANHILADSAATRHDLIDLYHTPPDKITVLLSGVDARFRSIEDDNTLSATRRKYNIGTQPYLFTIGTVQPRKNYARVVEALAALHQRGHDYKLVIAGGRGWLEDDLYHTIDRLNMQSHVKLIGFVDDADLPALYSSAACTVFVSLYEGFGLPVLESMACGTPVITSNISSLPEVAGDAAPTVAPTDTRAIRDTIEAVITNPAYHAELRAQGLAQARRFTWDNAAKQLMDVYEMMLAT